MHHQSMEKKTAKTAEKGDYDELRLLLLASQPASHPSLAVDVDYNDIGGDETE